MYMWEKTVMGISVHTAETEMATTPYSCTTVYFPSCATTVGSTEYLVLYTMAGLSAAMVNAFWPWIVW